MADLLAYNEKPSSEKSVKKKKKSNPLAALNFTPLQWLKRQMKIALVTKENSALGFKSILKKSVHGKNARFMESLIEMSMLCEENSISDFVDNL